MDFTMTPREIEAEIIRCIEVGLVPLLRSSPGLGKSSLMASIARQFKLKLIDIRLSQTVPEDMMGLPMKTDGDKASFMPFDMWPTEDTEIPAGYNGWLILLDEFNSAAKSVQAASYKLVLDRYVGQKKLHDNAFIVCAGNLETDRAIVNPTSTAMKSRLVHLFMEPDPEQWTKIAIQQDFDHRVIGFINFQPSKLMHFRPDSDDYTFACPRTYEFLSKYIKGRDMSQVKLATMAGIVGPGIAIEFNTFIKEFDRIPSYQSIKTNPTGVPIPGEASTQYALISMLLDRLDEDDLEDIFTYVKRMNTEIQVVYFRGIVARAPKLRRTKVYLENINHLVQFLNDDSDERAAA